MHSLYKDKVFKDRWKPLSTWQDLIKYMGIRPIVSNENFQDVISIANKNSQIPIRDFNDAVTILLTLVIPGKKKWQ